VADDRRAELQPLRVLVVDDEKPARLRLEDLLRRQPAVEIAGTARNGALAVEAIRALHPDLVFLDVQMPVMSGLDVVREVGVEVMPATIFVTAFDQYALQAFDVAAIDYLVKPFTDERFDQAFQRARRKLTLEGIERQRRQLLAALNSLDTAGGGKQEAAPPVPVSPSPFPVPASAHAHTSYLERIAVEMHGKVRVVPVGSIDYIVASGPYAELYVADKRYSIRERMQVLEERLDPGVFLRVHRSVIVRLELVEMLHRTPSGDYQLQIRGGVRLPVSRSRHEPLERWLGHAR
jgi:two-component system LytT family response regulator